MRGDVRVLLRLEKQCRKADRAARRIARKLSKRGGKQRQVHAVVQSPQAPMSFAPVDGISKHEMTVEAQRRLRRTRDKHGHRAFYVSELGSEMDEPKGIVLIPRTINASPHTVSSIITKTESSKTVISSAQVLLLTRHGGGELMICNQPTNKVVLRRLYTEHGLDILYACSACDSVFSQPCELRLDEQNFSSAQSLVARMLGARLSTADAGALM